MNYMNRLIQEFKVNYKTIKESFYNLLHPQPVYVGISNGGLENLSETDDNSLRDAQEFYLLWDKNGKKKRNGKKVITVYTSKKSDWKITKDKRGKCHAHKKRNGSR